MSKILPNVLEAVGNTPLIRLNRVTTGLAATVCAKVEACNPGRSVKDRIALALVEDAEKKGLLRPGGTIVEPTSGNMGVALAIVAAVKGYRCIFTIPDKMSIEKIRRLRAFGGKRAVARDDDILAILERAAQRLPRLAAHDHGVAGGERAEAREVRRQLPGKGVVCADHAVTRNGGDEGERP